MGTDHPLGHPKFGEIEICACRAEEIAELNQNQLYALSNLKELRALTFDNFKPRGRVGLRPVQAESLELAHTHAKQFASKLNGWLVLHGVYGSGKTHLAAAISNFVVDLGIQSIFLTVPDLLDTLRFTYDNPNESFENKFDQIRNTPLLILDDFGTQNATEWAQEKLFQIINYRYINQLPMVITTNLDLKDIDGRIRSRLEDPELVTKVNIQAPDYRNPMDDRGDNRLSTLHLHGDQTFANFQPRKNEGLPKEHVQNLQKAINLATKYADSPNGWIVFIGTYGSGKTHLASAIANFRMDLGFSPSFIVVPDLLDHLRATFNPKSSVSYDRLFDSIKQTPLLILDDLGTQSATPWAKEKLYQLFNYRYNAKLPTVITTSDYITDIDPRIQSRMRDERICTIVPISSPLYTGK